MLANHPVMTDKEFELFKVLMSDVAGINFKASKRHLVMGRLAKRLREYQLSSFEQYYELVTQDRTGHEFHCMVDLLTTHETSFFREPHHFEFITQKILPAVCDKISPARPLRIWSAASSTGEEAYSVAMLLMDRLGPDKPWEIVASDISRGSLQSAQRGVYLMDKVASLPNYYLKRYFLKGVGSKSGTVQVAPELRKRVRFCQVNLTGNAAQLGQFNVVFLRNVLIYFDQQTKRQVIAQMARRIGDKGWLFIGHSESLSGLSNGFKIAGPTTYQKC